MELTDLIRDNLAARAKVESGIAALVDERDGLEREFEGLSLAARRHGVDVSQILEAQPPTEMDRTDAIVSVLEDAGGSLSPNEIVGRLGSLGREDEYNAVSAAIAYLKRKNRVHSPARGQWAAGPNPSEMDHGGEIPFTDEDESAAMAALQLVDHGAR